MIGVKNGTECLLIPITKNCGTVIKQTHRKAEETLEFKHTKPTESFTFNPAIQIEGSWMKTLIILEVYISNFI